MRIAVIGTGISGLVTAWLLHDEHDLSVFEAGDYIGGHTHTVTVQRETRQFAVDTGFIVYNERNYPNFVKLLRRLDVPTQPSDMSFSVRCDATGLEYNPSTLNGLFAQRGNLLRPAFWGMLRDTLRFYRSAKRLQAETSDDTSLGEMLRAERYGARFIDKHIIPMGAAIWSADPDRFMAFPALYFLRFLDNHGMAQRKDRPQWRVIQGGSATYVRALTRPFADRIRLRTPVRGVTRLADGVIVETAGGEQEHFDQVVIATHSDQALAMLRDPTPAERAVLSAIPYQQNATVLHTDTSVLPRRRQAWASWNYHVPAAKSERLTMTYHMNRLQSLDADEEFCVSLNGAGQIDERRVIASMTYHHPVYTPGGVVAQRQRDQISGVNRTSYCGAYWGYGFHEDGVNSALAVGQLFGKGLD